jgi:DNA-binding CsgD family transcriptional regulator
MPCALSTRETEVLRWLSEGKTNKEIGAILNLSPRTVQKHLEHIYPKMGVETRTAAAIKSYQMVAISNINDYAEEVRKVLDSDQVKAV